MLTIARRADSQIQNISCMYLVIGVTLMCENLVTGVTPCIHTALKSTQFVVLRMGRQLFCFLISLIGHFRFPEAEGSEN
jgi:hypothetical protein